MEKTVGIKTIVITGTIIQEFKQVLKVSDDEVQELISDPKNLISNIDLNKCVSVLTEYRDIETTVDG
jgi:hypothetical protein